VRDNIRDGTRGAWRTDVKILYAGLLLAAVLSACSARPDAVIKSVYTSLSPASCKETPDKDRPDEAGYFSCWGVAGYSLNVRLVESGRESIDVINPAQNPFPLNYQYIVSRAMNSLDDKAEWRVSTQNGSLSPIALIVAVQAREDTDDPTKITNTYLAIAKIAPDGACVTDRIRQGSKSEAEVRQLADSTRNRPCAPELPVPAAAFRQP
jgi:hypothetical protein